MPLQSSHRVVVRLCRYGDHASCSENAGCKCKTCKAKALHAQLYPGEGAVPGGTRQERGLDLAFRPGSTDDLPSDARTLLGCAKARPPDKRIKHQAFVHSYLYRFCGAQAMVPRRRTGFTTSYWCARLCRVESLGLGMGMGGRPCHQQRLIEVAVPRL